MPELRKDPVSRRWVIIATERGKRPTDFVKVAPAVDDTGCPFCEGRERMTPEEVLAYRRVGSDPNGPGWWTRVVPARNSLLHYKGDIMRQGESIYDRMNTFGVHEIVIESPQHTLDLTTVPPSHFEHVLSAYRDRILEIRKDPRIRHLLIVKNYGKDAGSTFLKQHPHSHILGFPVVPRRVVDKFKGAQKFHSFRERCLWCDMLLQEQKEGTRVILDNKHFLSFAPFAARFPFEATIAPKRHMSRFEELSADELRHLADILRNTLARIFRVLQAPAFNYVFFSAPYDPKYDDLFHWHIEIMPRVTGIAGFEWGSGFYINPKSPEESAEALREAADCDIHAD